MSASGYAMRQRRKLLLTRSVAGALALVLLVAIGLGAASSFTGEAEPPRTPPATEVEVGTAKASEILSPTTASPALDAAITALLSAERFRFQLRMKPIAADSETSWLVTGEADVATALNDPPRLRAQVAIGSGDAYSVISEQLRVGEALYNKDAETGAYVRGQASGSEDLGAVDPVTTILGSLRELPAASFQEIASPEGTRTLLVRADGQLIDGDITSMKIVIDAETNLLRSMRFRSKAMTSSVVISDLGDPAIDIQSPSL